ncbi:MAG TPA: response regulator [Candidatus Saccharibacteria bacterium]|nr:response regulator [Candidatus Saccharibacteria bacterium]
MSKIMLVEDDNSLLEIYEARLKAEGYDIVTARDGEEALTVALKEHPDLIIADVMMPKVSGFDMVDILRSTPETKATKIIMMTALNQAEDKARAEKLGADKYLVKSQVTLEDVARIVHDVLAEQDAAAAAAVTSATGVEPSKTQNKSMPVNPVIPSLPSDNDATKNQPATPATSTPQTPQSNIATPAIPSPVTAKPLVSSQPMPKMTTAIPVTPAPEPTKSDPVTSMPKVPDQQPPASPQTATATPTTTSIPITTDDSDENKTTDATVVPTVKDPFLAKNPTLSDSPDPAPPTEVSSPPTESVKVEVDNSIAQNAVDSLATPSVSESANASDNTLQNSSEDATSTKYLKTDKDDKSRSMVHNKVIEPTPSQEDDDNPTLTNLSEIPDVEVASSPPPAVNTVIAPDPDKGLSNSTQD